MGPNIGVIGAFDTKGADYACIIQEILSASCKVVAIDIGVFEPNVPFRIDVTCKELLSPEHDIQELRTRKDRPYAIQVIKQAIEAKIAQIVQKFQISALFGMGGSNGTEVVTCAMRQLDEKMPKVCLSTVARHVDTSHDIILIDSCVDVGGLNAISREKYADAATVISALAKRRMSKPVLLPRLPTIGISMFGNTTKCVEKCSNALKQQGFDMMPFHAVGTGGKYLEKYVIQEKIDAGVLDLTLQEVAAHILKGPWSAGIERLDAPCEKRVPHIIVPGCMDMVIFTEDIQTLEKRYPGRHLYPCNDHITALRTNAEENRLFGRFIAEKVNRAIQKMSPVMVLIPTKGFSMFEETLPEWRDKEANRALVDALVEGVERKDRVKLVDAYVNDDQFAQELTQAFKTLSSCKKRE